MIAAWTRDWSAGMIAGTADRSSRTITPRVSAWITAGRTAITAAGRIGAISHPSGMT
jgi:hypothetical protein